MSDLDLATEAAQLAGSVAAAVFGEPLEVVVKGAPANVPTPRRSTPSGIYSLASGRWTACWVRRAATAQAPGVGWSMPSTAP
jgi:hypothetical protein